MRWHNAARAVIAQFVFESNIFARDRLSLFWSLVFPVMLVLILGYSFGSAGGSGAKAAISYPEWLLAGVIGTNLMGMALFNIGTSLLTYRERGIFARVVVAGIPAERILAGLMLNRYAIVAAQLFLMLVTAHMAFGIRVPLRSGSFALVMVLGVVCFTCLGLIFAMLVRTASAAMALGNAVYLPLAFLSGAYFDIGRLPGATLWRWLPSSTEIDALRLALHAPLAQTIGSAPFVASVLWTLAFTALVLALRGRLVLETR